MGTLCGALVGTPDPGVDDVSGDVGIVAPGAVEDAGEPATGEAVDAAATSVVDVLDVVELVVVLVVLVVLVVVELVVVVVVVVCIPLSGATLSGNSSFGPASIESRSA